MSIEDIYAKLPSIICKGLCHDSCGIIPLSPKERERIAAFTGRRVKVIPDAIANLHPGHRLLRPSDADSLDCTYLKKKRCSIHAVRPLICRMYGVVAGMPCPYGCQPSAELVSDKRAEEIIEEVANLK